MKFIQVIMYLCYVCHVLHALHYAWHRLATIIMINSHNNFLKKSQQQLCHFALSCQHFWHSQQQLSQFITMCQYLQTNSKHWDFFFSAKKAFCFVCLLEQSNSNNTCFLHWQYHVVPVYLSTHRFDHYKTVLLTQWITNTNIVSCTCGWWPCCWQ